MLLGRLTRRAEPSAPIVMAKRASSILCLGSWANPARVAHGAWNPEPRSDDRTGSKTRQSSYPSSAHHYGPSTRQAKHAFCGASRRGPALQSGLLPTAKEGVIQQRLVIREERREQYSNATRARTLLCLGVCTSDATLSQRLLNATVCVMFAGERSPPTGLVIFTPSITSLQCLD